MLLTKENMHQITHGNQLEAPNSARFKTTEASRAKATSGAKKQKREQKAYVQNEGFEKQEQRHQQKLAERRAGANACLAQFSLFRRR